MFEIKGKEQEKKESTNGYKLKCRFSAGKLYMETRSAELIPHKYKTHGTLRRVVLTTE